MATLLENPLFGTYCFYGGILAVKMLAMSALTGRQRQKKEAFANPEDAAKRNAKVKTDDDVERVRRAHLNDLENITVFFAVGLIYISTNPNPTLATLLFRAFTTARIAHTLVYAVYVVPQPARAISFGIGYLITGYMAVKSIIYFA